MSWISISGGAASGPRRPLRSCSIRGLNPDGGTIPTDSDASARRMASVTASRTSDGLRKRTSRFCGWTFTSTLAGSTSRNRQQTG